MPVSQKTYYEDYVQKVLSRSPSAWYPTTEVQVTSTLANSLNASDFAHVPTSGIAFGQPGQYQNRNGLVLFGGTSYVAVDPSAATVVNMATAFSVSFYFRTSGTHATNLKILEIWDGSNKLTIEKTTGAELKTSYNAVTSTGATNLDIANDTWILVNVTVAGGVIKTYVEGLPYTTVSTSIASVPVAAITFGATVSSGQLTDFSRMGVGDIIFFDRELSELEVKYLFFDDVSLAAGSPPDGSETKVTAGTNVTVTGTGTTLDPYVVNSTYTADGSETKVVPGSNVSVTGSGTTLDPYVVNSTYAVDGSETKVTSTKGIIVSGSGTTLDPYDLQARYLDQDVAVGIFPFALPDTPNTLVNIGVGGITTFMKTPEFEGDFIVDGDGLMFFGLGGSSKLFMLDVTVIMTINGVGGEIVELQLGDAIGSYHCPPVVPNASMTMVGINALTDAYLTTGPNHNATGVVVNKIIFKATQVNNF